jgi:predicted dehydrogenase
VRSPDVDVVVISTPPVTHADWALELLEAGKHVVLEKPMALTSASCDQVIEVAQGNGLLAVVYQNRRFDPDFRALQKLIRAGELGDVFHLEAFVGRFSHPCNYWHSDAEVSGGALFDWGSHIIDQIVQLMPGEIQSVTARNQKLLWHDVTNADHARMTLHYSDGREASFIYSDISAALKPRWYLAGTKGGVIGSWRHERVVHRSAIGTLSEDVLDPADSPPELTLYAADGRISQIPGDYAPQAAFHSELADYLSLGLPMTVNAQQSRRVVALLEAAELSALEDGSPIPVS